MSFPSRIAILAVTLALLAGGCFPDSQGLSDLSLQLSLNDLGLENATAKIRDWQDWYDNGHPRSMTFDLGQPGRGFYLGLYLDGFSPDGDLVFTGSRVEIADDLLTVDLDVAQCTDCQFSAVIFWEESELVQRVETFTGQSTLFNVVPGSVPEFVDLDAYLAQVGSLRCLPANPDNPKEVTLAIMDVQEGVIFPSVSGTLDDQGLILPDVPTGRPVNIINMPLGAGAWSSEPLLEDVIIQEPEGQGPMDVVIDP